MNDNSGGSRNFEPNSNNNDNGDKGTVKVHDHKGPLLSQKITPLNEMNWMVQKPHITNLLKPWDVLDHVMGKIKMLEDNEANKDELTEWNKHNTVAIMLIHNNVESEQMIHINSCDMAAEMWENLKGVYDTHSKQAVCTVQRRMIYMRY